MPDHDENAVDHPRCGECGGGLGAHRCVDCGTRHNGPDDEREVVAKALYDHEPKYQRRHEGTEQRRYWVDLYASEKAVYRGRADAALAALSGSSGAHDGRCEIEGCRICSAVFGPEAEGDPVTTEDELSRIAAALRDEFEFINIDSDPFFDKDWKSIVAAVLRLSDQENKHFGRSES